MKNTTKRSGRDRFLPKCGRNGKNIFLPGRKKPYFSIEETAPRKKLPTLHYCDHLSLKGNCSLSYVIIVSHIVKLIVRICLKKASRSFFLGHLVVMMYVSIKDFGI